MRVLRKFMLSLSLALTSLPAFGQQCAGFADVPSSNGFCQDIEWIRNRSVTLGCLSPPLQYCPNGLVDRSQMAAFMRRLGDALTPDIIRTIDAAFDGTYNPNGIGCISAPYPITGSPDYPRQASFAAILYNFNPTPASPKGVQGELVYSTDAGASWQQTGDIVAWHTIDPGKPSTLPLVGGPLNLVVGSTYQFAIRAITNDPTVSISGECQLNVRIESRTGAASPF